MSNHLWLLQRTTVPAPGEVAAYLLQQGWVHQMSNSQWAVFQKSMEGRSVTLEVPQRAAAIDYPRAVGTLLDDLIRLENRPAAAIVRDLKAAAVDIIRLTIDSAVTRDGRVPVEAGRRVYEAARDLLLAAACSVIDPRPVFPKRKPDEAMRLLDRARFGPTEVGSFVLTVELGVGPRLQPSLLDDGDSDAPLERKTSLRLAQALQGAEAATRESSASGSLGPFADRSRSGVSANLCEAIAEIIEATDAEKVGASFSFAARRPLVADVPRQVLFSADTAPILREAATRLRDQATFPETEVIGPVVKLDSSDPTQGGEVVLKAEIEGRYRSVKITLGPGSYAKAIAAHQERLLVRCTGELAREGYSMVLRNARDFSAFSEAEDP